MHRLDARSDHLNPDLVRSLADAGADVNCSTALGERPIEAAAQRLLPSTVAAFLDLGAAPANALTTVLAWWSVNVRWAGYRAVEVVDVITTLRGAGAPVTDRDREFAAQAGDPTVASALDD
jgi:hypothetical protein